jgi:hypothetical protein
MWIQEEEGELINREQENNLSPYNQQLLLCYWYGKVNKCFEYSETFININNILPHTSSFNNAL